MDIRRSPIQMVAAICAMVALAGCQQLPGNRTQQTTAGGTAAGAAAGAALMENDLIGALLGGAAGAAGGYLVGARTDWFDQATGDRSSAAREAVENARHSPATAAQVRAADTADVNDDGFVTMDEFIAMADAGLSGEQIIDRLEATGQVFQLSAEQRERLVGAGLSPAVVARVDEINRDERDGLFEDDSDVISRRAS